VFQGATGRLVHRAPSPATGGDASSTPQ
jgi:hypothetical protein